MGLIWRFCTKYAAFLIVADLKLRGGVEKRRLMFAPYYGRSRAFTANYRSWHDYHRESVIVEVAAELLSHETLHIEITGLRSPRHPTLTTSLADRIVESSHHGLGNLDRVHRNSAGQYARKRG